jgi:selenide,water dikinase
LVGIDTSDDAAVYRINDDLAMIQTLDFFTPVVDDPYTFGLIAAANSLSDVYAMGGEPRLALNIVCFPECLEPSVLSEILRGGYDKVTESGAILVGGHSVSDDEPKYGLSVTGFVHPESIKKNSSSRPGDVLVLTKPLGLGIINTAIKGELASEESYDKAVKVMTTLNREGMEAFKGLSEVNSVTDITGFGLLGHCLEMAEGSNTTIIIESKKVPYIEEARDYAEMGLIPAGAYNNRSHIGNKVEVAASVPRYLEDILFDPQTSGGLLISASPKTAGIIMDNLKDSEIPHGIIGRVVNFTGTHLKVE